MEKERYISNLEDDYNLKVTDDSSFAIKYFGIETSDGKFYVDAFEYAHCCGAMNFAGMIFYPFNKSLAIKCFKGVLNCTLRQNINFATYITQKDGQKDIQQLLTEIGFTVVDTFRNSNTGNECLLWTANLANLNLD